MVYRIWIAGNKKVDKFSHVQLSKKEKIHLQ